MKNPPTLTENKLTLLTELMQKDQQTKLKDHISDLNKYDNLLPPAISLNDLLKDNKLFISGGLSCLIFRE